MADDLYANLAWLPKPPPDFRQRCNAILEAKGAEGRTLATLSRHSLNETQLRHLAQAFELVYASGRSLAPLIPFTLGLVGNTTLDHLAPALVASSARHGIALKCIQADFGQTLAEGVSAESALNLAQPDAVLMALDYRGLPLVPGHLEREAASHVVNEMLAFVDQMRQGFRTHGRAVCIAQTLAPPPETLFGSFDRAVAGSTRQLIETFNAELVDRVATTGDLVFDVASLAQTVGLANWHSPTQWNLAKFPFDSRFVPLYADHVGRLIGALRGKSRRCLILDLDNTLWGGVIGDDGMEGIILGQGDATGEAYIEVQRMALALRDRGVVLAVSSKNSDDVARNVFANHPDMVLSERHIAVFQANWNDKATNIAAIASELSLGLDAMVFLDDNPVERGLIREILPDVAVPELPDNPALFARTLAAAGYFESIAISDEDRRRAEFYETNAKRVALSRQVGDVESYLASLNMEITFRPFDATARARITQLINKSNQFNLTTRRYTEHEVAQCEQDPQVFTLQVRLADAFGDNGMISVVICRPRSYDTWEFDTWLMSCRVLGRRVEHMVLREVLQHAKARGVRTLIGIYKPSERNEMVRDHYAKLGFRASGGPSAGETTWELDTDATVEAAPMRIDSSGFIAPESVSV